MERVTLDVTTLGLGLLVARLVFGLLLAAHGAQKLFGWFGGHGLAGTGGWMESIGFRPGRLFAAAAGAGEFGGGLLTALGALGPVGPALLIAVMVVAIGSVHWANGLFNTKNGIELPLLNAVMALAIALTGPGVYSADAALGLARAFAPAFVVVVLVLGFLGGLANLALRRPAPAAARA